MEKVTTLFCCLLYVPSTLYIVKVRLVCLKSLINQQPPVCPVPFLRTDALYFWDWFWPFTSFTPVQPGWLHWDSHWFGWKPQWTLAGITGVRSFLEGVNYFSHSPYPSGFCKSHLEPITNLDLPRHIILSFLRKYLHRNSSCFYLLVCTNLIHRFHQSWYQVDDILLWGPVLYTPKPTATCFGTTIILTRWLLLTTAFLLILKSDELLFDWLRFCGWKSIVNWFFH